MYHTTDIKTMFDVFGRIATARQLHAHPCFEALTEEFLEVARAMQDHEHERVQDELLDLITVAWRMYTEYWVKVQDVMYAEKEAEADE